MYIFFTIVVLLLAWLYKIDVVNRLIKFWRIVQFSKTLPGPGLFELFKNSKKDRVLPWMQENRLKYGPLFRIWFGKDLLIFITDPDDAKIALGSQELLYKSKNYNILEPWLGLGLLTSGGQRWHRNRKILTPAFHFKILGAFKQPMLDCGQILIDRLREKVDGEVFDVYPYITLYALDVICETAMGIKKNAQVNSETDYIKAVQRICSILHMRSFSIWRRIPFLAQFGSENAEYHKTLKVLHNETRHVIEIRRKLLDEDQISNVPRDDDAMIGMKRRLAFLDMLLIAQREGAQLNDENIREEVDTFMFEGHDTTSSALSFALYLLSQNREEQTKLHAEISKFDIDELESMKYLDAVIKETLRLYPSVPFYSRGLDRDYKMKEGVIIPAGTAISVLSYMVHRDPEHYPNPEAFRPERFLDEDVKHHPYAHVAFSAGPRNCIGQKFAMLELRLTLFKLVKEYEFMAAAGFKPIPLAELMLKSANGVQLKIRKRSP